jgi:hypothetical protein
MRLPWFDNPVNSAICAAQAIVDYNRMGIELVAITEGAPLGRTGRSWSGSTRTSANSCNGASCSVRWRSRARAR